MTVIPATVIITLLVLFIGISIVFGGIAWSRINSLFLPFPTSITAIATLFPVLSFLIVATINSFVSRFEGANSRRKRITASDGANGTTATGASTAFGPLVAFFLDNIMTILPTVLATISATYILPSDNNCHLEQAWQAYYHNKDVNAIRSIQDRLQCCGLRSTRDRAWPFKDATHSDMACEQSMGYRQSCLEPWSDNERKVAVLVFAAAVLGWGIKLGFMYLGPRGFWTFNNSTFGRRAWTHGTSNGIEGPSYPRLLPRYADDPNDIQRERDEEDPSTDTAPGEHPLLDADARDVTSPDGRDLSGTSPWRESE
ncbi:hypothetical protein PISL3812_04369 [Talaromyces islandicus]|uniref:Tetraspanin Tsp3 n=1 Tax=Talaromyces islandicus TaxID=28573 RepID=A0A0U1LW90_TALIS|nr:hypothetical protein PISL3812_04369 [Talaromyces islandicus]